VRDHRLSGIYIFQKGRDENLVTESMVVGKSIYGEKRISAEKRDQKTPDKFEFRLWNPYRSKLGASIVNGVQEIYMKPGSKVLYLGAASGTTVSHVADIVGKEGAVYAVEFAKRPARQLMRVAQDRQNVLPILADARKPNLYRLMVPLVDVIFSDVAQPDQTEIVMLNAKHYLKQGGEAMIAIKASCVDSLADPEEVFEAEKAKLEKAGWELLTQVTLEPYQRHHAMICARFRPTKN